MTDWVILETGVRRAVIAGVCSTFLLAATAMAVPAAPRTASPPAAPAAAGAPVAADTGVEAKLRLPVLLTGQAACPPGATWQTVLDHSPVPRCKTPLQAGCMLADGRRHGPWTVYAVDQKCSVRQEVFTFKKGRKTGPAAQYGARCRRGRRGRPPRCREILLRQGGYDNGKAHGMWLSIDAQGRKRSQSQMHTGVKHGPFYFFNSSGLLIGRGCNQDGKEVWRYDFHNKDRWNTPCASKRIIVKKPVGTGIAKVSAAQAKASKMVQLSQMTKNAGLRLLYLRKAVGLVPDNVRYQKLLADAEASAK